MYIHFVNFLSTFYTLKIHEKVHYLQLFTYTKYDPFKIPPIPLNSKSWGFQNPLFRVKVSSGRVLKFFSSKSS